MKRTSLSLAGGLATALMLVTAPTASAAVGAKDVPGKGDIVAAFPELAGGQFTSQKTKQVAKPGKTCGTATTEKARSGATTTAVSSSGTSIVVAGAAEVVTPRKAASFLGAYRKYVKKCGTFTEPTTGAVITSTLGKSLKLGDGSLTVDQQTTINGVVSYSTSVLAVDGRRLAILTAIDDAAIPTSSIKKLAKVAVKKLR